MGTKTRTKKTNSYKEKLYTIIDIGLNCKFSKNKETILSGLNVFFQKKKNVETNFKKRHKFALKTGLQTRQ